VAFAILTNRKPASKAGPFSEGGTMAPPGILLAVMLALGPVRLAVLGDRTGGADDEQWARTIRSIAMMEPDLVVSVGDLIEGYCDSSSAAAQWQAVMESLEPLRPFGILATPGNHDVWDGASEGLWTGSTGWPVEGVVRRLGIDFVIWDTSREGRLTPELISRLDSLLAMTDEAGCAVVVTHKPLWSMAEADSALAGRFYGLLLRRGADAVLSGHVHAAACQRRDGVLLATVGPSGVRIGEPFREAGIFTQFGWLTLGEGGHGFALIESGAVHPESLNTSLEQRLHYLYRNRMLEAGPLSPAGGGVSVVLHPFEERPRRVTVDVREEGWRVTPEGAEVELEGSPDTLTLQAEVRERLLPLPSLRVGLSYGPRDKELELTETLPLARPVPGALCLAAADGNIAEGEYPAEAMEVFVGRDGGPSDMPPTEAMVAVGPDSLRVAFDCSEHLEDDEAGLVIASGDRSMLVFAGPEVEASGYVRTGGGPRSSWDGGWSVAVTAREDGWVMEAAVALEELGDPDSVGMNVFRSAGWRLGCWSWPLTWEGRLMGPLELEPSGR